jgi:hypothetical protein
MKLYMQTDAIAKHEDFDIWCDDGSVGFSVTGDWTQEKDHISVYGHMGTRIGRIKPDRHVLNYYLEFDRYTYEFHTRRIFQHYHIEGMAWDIQGGLTSLPVDFLNVLDDKKEVHLRLLDFKEKGECYELRTTKADKVHIAIGVLISMAIKEEYKGLSEGEKDEEVGRLDKVKRFFIKNKGESLQELERDERAS